MKFTLKEDGKRFIVITLASVLMALNLNTFVQSGGLYPGGVTGLTVLILRVIKMMTGRDVSYTVVNLLLNLFPIYLGFRYVGKKLTIYSLYVITLTSVLADLIPNFTLTSDILLISIFGGLIGGTATVMCLVMNANTGGTDFIALFLSERKGIESWNIILGINVVILSAAGLLFGWDKALYSIIYQFVCTQIIHTFYTRYQQMTLFIVTNLPKEVCAAINEISHHGATIMHGEGAYQDVERAIVYSIVAREEYKKVMKKVKETDPKAFINSIRTEQLSGGFYRRPTE